MNQAQQSPNPGQPAEIPASIPGPSNPAGPQPAPAESPAQAPEPPNPPPPETPPRQDPSPTPVPPTATKDLPDGRYPDGKIEHPPTKR